jgi:predicted permease
MKSIVKKASIAVFVLALVAGAVAWFGRPVMGIDFSGGINGGINGTGVAEGNVTADNVVKNAINIMLYVVGAASIIMLIYGGIRYTTSRGESDAIKSAKNTILYAIIGLVVAMLAYAIVNFVMGQL